MPEVIVCVGHIASGKGTYCKQRAQEGWLILNDDAIVNMIHGGDYTLYNKNLKPLYKSIEDHVFHIAVLANKNLVIDRGLDVSVNARSRWIALARSLDVPIKAVVFEVFPPETHAERRFMADSRGHTLEYWITAARRHAFVYVEPTLEEGFCEIQYKNWDS